MQAGSRPFAGSSRMSTGGSPSRAWASASRCRMPSEKPPTRVPATSDNPTCPSNGGQAEGSIEAARAITSRCAKAERPGWKLEASSAAPTVPIGSASSR